MYAKILKEANEAAEKMYANMFEDSTAIFSAEASNGIQANSTSTIQTNTGDTLRISNDNQECSYDAKELKSKWGIDDRFYGVGNCILGYPAEIPEAKPRKENYVIKVK
jgi:hypothetical protein